MTAPTASSTTVAAPPVSSGAASPSSTSAPTSSTPVCRRASRMPWAPAATARVVSSSTAANSPRPTVLISR